VESFVDDYAEVQGVILPKTRRVIFAEHGEAQVRMLTLSDHALL
jgi:hypothetical protein